SWLFVALGYTEDNNLYNQVLAAGSFANAKAAGILPARTKLTRCPSDGFENQNGVYCNYVASVGPQCNHPPAGCPAPFPLHRHHPPRPAAAAPARGGNAPRALVPPTHPGYGPSMTWGSNVTGPNDFPGMFARTTPTTPAATWTTERRAAALTIRVADVLDGT